jgi:hypothetical protein
MNKWFEEVVTFVKKKIIKPEQYAEKKNHLESDGPKVIKAYRTRIIKIKIKGGLQDERYGGGSYRFYMTRGQRTMFLIRLAIFDMTRKPNRIQHKIIGLRLSSLPCLIKWVRLWLVLYS